MPETRIMQGLGMFVGLVPLVSACDFAYDTDPYTQCAPPHRSPSEPGSAVDKGESSASILTQTMPQVLRSLPRLHRLLSLRLRAALLRRRRLRRLAVHRPVQPIRWRQLHVRYRGRYHR